MAIVAAKKSGKLSFFRTVLLAALYVCCSADLRAAAPSDGFFYGVEMEPVGNASIATVETEPAVALIFAADAKTADITRQFDEWYGRSDRPDVEVFAIAVEPGDLSREVILEAINQRNLQMPVFLSRYDMLLGDDFRLVVLNNDQEVRRFTTLDFAGVNAALAELNGATPGPATTPAPAAITPTPAVIVEPVTPTPEATPEPRPEVEVKVDSGILPDGSSYTRVTTVTRTKEDRVGGGKEVDNLYTNERFGMVVQFPSGWQYRIANQEDGAVGIPPPGSQMDIRIWALAAGSVQTPQQYIDETLESLARKLGTRVKVDRRFEVRDDGEPGVDITYSYTKPFDVENVARGGMLHRGRMQVFVDEGYIKAVSADAPSGEFQVAMPLIEAFFLSFEINPDINPPPAEYDSPNI